MYLWPAGKIGGALTTEPHSGFFHVDNSLSFYLNHHTVCVLVIIMDPGYCRLIWLFLSISAFYCVQNYKPAHFPSSNPCLLLSLLHVRYQLSTLSQSHSTPNSYLHFSLVTISLFFCFVNFIYDGFEFEFMSSMRLIIIAWQFLWLRTLKETQHDIREPQLNLPLCNTSPINMQRRNCVVLLEGLRENDGLNL